MAYAAEFGVSNAEAERRLTQQWALDAPMQDMRALAPERFAGAWLEHVPEFRAVVAFTGDREGLEAVEARAAAAGPDVVVLPDARHTLDELYRGLERIDQRLQADFPEMGSEVAIKEGAIRLSGPTTMTPLVLAELGAVAGVSITTAVTPPLELQHTYGGRKVTFGNPFCTTGFTVRHVPSGDKGVLTAGHCSDNNIVYYDLPPAPTYPLTWKGQFRDSSHDAQWMRENTHTVYDDFYDGNGLVDQNYLISRANAQGDFVCHMGYGSNPYVFPLGQSCGTVTNTAFDPGNYCGDTGSLNCDAVWVKVEGPNLACYGGDSGGPWHAGSNVYGIHTGGAQNGPAKGQCALVWFMSQEFLGDMNLAILQ